uniref:Archaeal chlorohydrolase family protein n=1 Tax=uncultured euryarchaeote Alv-FOS4 TaxID=337893 RepID=Q3SA82_9EURY|nr:archaeal chlorohydrolase family protein [uncultured euryarchaeote Alv-FOS4]
MKIYGNILLRDEFFKGTVEIKDGILVGVWREKREYDIRGTVIPTFVNMHTHLGDSWYPEEPQGTLEEVVGPGGLKFKILKDEEKVKEGIRAALRKMERCGVSHFVDFREGGARGVQLLAEALAGSSLHGIILGRGGLWHGAAGISVSSISDVEREEIEELRALARKNGALFAMHASENRRERIDDVLALRPDFLVHLTSAPSEDLKRVAEANIPVVITPRANAFWGIFPDIPLMRNAGLKLALGTDNGMIASPCMFREMEFAYRLARLRGGVAPEEIIKMATIRGREILGIDDNYEGAPARVIVFKGIMTPYEIVTRAGVEDIKIKVF